VPPVRHRSLPWLAFALYIVLSTGLLIALGIPIAPDRYFFVLLLFSYEYLRGLAGRFGTVHYLTGIRFDSMVFGTPPTVTLQQRLAHGTSLAPYDVVAAVLYLLHFVMPLSFAFLLWLRRADQFSRFTAAFLVVSYAALATFLLYPAAPPWLASQAGYLPEVHERVSTVLSAFPARFHLPTVYALFDPNQVAAIPSLHAAYPLLILLFACRFFGLRGLVVLPYVAGVWLAVVYLGEHYVFDVAVGALYSGGAFALTELVLPRLWRPAEARRRIVAA